MANITCSNGNFSWDKWRKENRFIGCDGKVLSNELLEAQLEKAINREDYEDAAVIRDELNRRKKLS